MFKMFNHIELKLPTLERTTIDGVRYYFVPDEEELRKLVSITSVTSHFNKEIFVKWRKKVGEAEAEKITKQATERGTDYHTLAENYFYNKSRYLKYKFKKNGNKYKKRRKKLLFF